MPDPYSEKFDDIYFSQEDGLAETIHTFIEANEIKEITGQKDKLIVGELGFGTGLNFLALCNYLYRNHAETSRITDLEFWSIEKYPLTKEEISRALSKWDSLSEELSLFLTAYPDSLPQKSTTPISIPFSNILNNIKISLYLFIGEVSEMISYFPSNIDCWFFDGFAPEKNPEMWTVDLFRICYEKSSADATASTFTAAGLVKRNLKEAGFSVKRLKGFGKKRHMVKAFKRIK